MRVSIKTCLKEVGWESLVVFYQAEDRDREGALLGTVMSLRIP